MLLLTPLLIVALSLFHTSFFVCHSVFLKATIWKFAKICLCPLFLTVYFVIYSVGIFILLTLSLTGLISPIQFSLFLGCILFWHVRFFHFHISFFTDFLWFFLCVLEFMEFKLSIILLISFFFGFSWKAKYFKQIKPLIKKLCVLVGVGVKVVQGAMGNGVCCLELQL